MVEFCVISAGQQKAHFFYVLYEFTVYLYSTKWCFALLCAQTSVSDSYISPRLGEE